MRPTKYKFTPELDLAIRELYLNKVRLNKRDCPAPVQTFANEVEIPVWAISCRARELGVIPFSGSGANWSNREKEILNENSGKSIVTIQKKLKKDGYSRSLSAIINKFKKYKISRKRDGYSASSLAVCLGVDTRTVISKITSGKLIASNSKTLRTKCQFGNSYLMTDQQIKKFIIKYVDEIDIRKVDKFWFVSILTSKSIT